MLLANSISKEHFFTDTPNTTTQTFEMQYRRLLRDSLYEHDSIYRENTLRAMSSKTMILPLQDYFKKVNTYIDTVIELRKKNNSIQTNTLDPIPQKSDTLTPTK